MNIPATKSRGNAARCTLATLVFMVFAMMGSVANAQILAHGVSIQKVCVGAARICPDNDYCEDGDLCTNEVCNTETPNTSNCYILLGYNDDFGDTIDVKESWDIVDLGGDNVRVPAAGNLPIYMATGNTTCVEGPFAPCTIGPELPESHPDGPLDKGGVVFQQNQYVIQTDDPSPLPDRGHVTVADQCNGDTDANCNGDDNTQQFTAQQALTSGCEDGPPVMCPDGLECNTEPVCNPGTGLCEDEPTPGVPCADTDGSMCTDAICNDQGVCDQQADVVQCPAGEECNTVPMCDPADGQCKSDPTPDVPCADTDGSMCTDAICNDQGVCDQQADVVQCPAGEECNTEPMCDPADGQCKSDPTPGESCTDTDGSACTDALCTAEGVCDQQAEVVQCPAGEECNTEPACDPADGQCKSDPTPGESCTDTDGSACTDALCNAEGECDQVAEVVTCEDETCQVCDPANGECLDKNPLPDECVAEGCLTRTRGYWTQHNFETQAVVDAAEGLSTCGEDILTNANSNDCGRGRVNYSGLAGNLKAQCIAATLNFASSSVGFEDIEGECSGQLAASVRTCDEDSGDREGWSCGYEEDGYCASDAYPNGACSPLPPNAAEFYSGIILGMCCNGINEQPSVCEAGGDQNAMSTCVDLLSSFNESMDTDPLDDVGLCDDLEPSHKDEHGHCKAHHGVCLGDADED